VLSAGRSAFIGVAVGSFFMRVPARHIDQVAQVFRGR